MPGIAILTGTALVPAGTFPYSIVIGGQEVAPTKAALESIRIEDNADDEPARLSVKVWDANNSLDLLDGSVCYVHDSVAEVDIFLGRVQRRWHDPAAVGRYVNIEAVSISAMLDDVLVPLAARPAGESDRARVLYFWGKYARWPLSGDPQFVTQTEANLPADAFINLTLRSTLRQIAAAAGSTVRFGVDANGRLHWFAGTETNPAPFNINVAQTPGGGNIAPDDLKVDRDGTITNRVYVRGATLGGSGYFQDDLSVSQYGPREKFIDAPSADTAAKALSIARLYFGRVSQPRIRGRFTTRSPNDGWRAGQNVTVTSAQEDMSAQAFRIVRVTTTFTKGTGTRAYAVEFGKVGARSSSAEEDPLGEVGPTGLLLDQAGQLIMSTLQSSTALIGSAVRRYIQSGVFNGDFVAPPLASGSAVSDANPLPFWIFTQAGGSAITAQSVEDSASGSGRILTFNMAAGAAGDDSYIEQIIPINGSLSQSYAYAVGRTWKTGPTVSAAQLYAICQFLEADGVTTVGAAITRTDLTSDIGADTVFDQTLGPDQGLLAPATAYYLRVRIGFKRNTAPTSTTENVTLAEVRVIVGETRLQVVDANAPGTYRPTIVTYENGTFSLWINRAGTSGFEPAMTMLASSGAITLYTNNGAGVVLDRTDAGQKPFLQFGERTDPSAPAGNNARLYARDDGSGKTQLVAIFPTGAAQVIATEP